MIQIHPTVLIILSGVAMSIIGFFVTLFISRVNSTQQTLSQSIDKLNLSLTGLNAMISSMKDMDAKFSDDCTKRHSVIDKRLDAHAGSLKTQENKLVELDTKINLG
jgi:hypothetical protein